ncbi:3-phosphoshikimate 1-carboxyvinyltransferase [Mucilaginibacter paludis]|uniref:3-phosphoshikimate 1-carboxyvinyltransferase n=1 Tax=Mucilaginibacter paludis DSM 18603 TaxID=714943 RepID=H1YGD9_9SPHI|nr:3-phosphoshikimate 1-carboxyvinyltransferase [Mucilaginibacter paludis]EHQ24491.1 3-phosphoshikimate 1-carboxyvinyltransferase [Mucilaginibacter paludis DSM 18603]
MQANIIISKATKTLSGTIQLTGSKSECNRALIIEALSKGKVKVLNISDAADAVTLAAVLKVHSPWSIVHSQAVADREPSTIDRQPPTMDHGPSTMDYVDIGPAGTAMRFLTAYLPLLDKNIIITGTKRMQQRPIGILVDAMRKLGAKIDYQVNEGFPPLQIHSGFQQKTDRISIKGNISSQYITALLLIAPSLPLGLTLEIEGELTSKPYVEMTLAMLQQVGIQHTWDDNNIHIANQPFKETSILVEPDWSAASYWYAIAALCDEAELFLPALTPYSLQGDSVITEIMANFGITSQFKDGGVHLQKEAKPILRKIFDFKECPDLAQTVIVVCAALGHDATFTGLETLKIKETDRVAALQNELAKIGVKLTEKGQVYKLDCSEKQIPEKVTIRTYEDHRMAMAFAPLALVVPQVEVEEPQVVEKSYPAFWSDLEKAGFKVDGYSIA